MESLRKEMVLVSLHLPGGSEEKSEIPYQVRPLYDVQTGNFINTVQDIQCFLCALKKNYS
jgi:hypothetical protein